MYRIPYENEQITKTIAAPYAPVDFTEEEKAQFRDNIGAGTDSASETELLDLKMLGWTVPKDFPIQNFKDDSGVYHQLVGRVAANLLNLAFIDASSYPNIVYANVSNLKNNGYVACTKYDYVNVHGWSTVNQYETAIASIAQRVVFKDASLSTIDQFKTNLEGVYVYYELATEITHPVDGYEVAEGIVLLWENASLASSFPAQTINLDLSAYKFVLIVYKYGITSIGGTGGAIIMANGDYAKLIGLFNNKLSNRNVDLRTPNQVKFLVGDRNDEYGGADITDNRLIIPHRIYGMK